MTTSEYNKCVDQHADGVYRFILKNLKDEDDAKDVVQDSFEKLWNKLETVVAEKAKSYLFSAAYHTMIDRIRKNKKQVLMDDATVENHFYEESYSDLKPWLDKGLERLPEIQKHVILLRDYEGYSYEEIGEITGLNESQVKVYIYRARLALKEFLGKMENLV